MPRALFALILLPLLLAGGCTSNRSSAPAPAGEPAEPTETTAMDETSETGEASEMDEAAPQDCSYKTTQLSGPTQVQIDCANGTSVVVRQRADGKWEEEARAVAGSRPSYASVEEAARAICCR